MTCNLTRQTPAEAYQMLLDSFSTNVLGGAPVVPETNEWYVVNNDYAAYEIVQSMMKSQVDEMDWEKMSDETFLKKAAERGMRPLPASFAEGFVKVTGTAGTSIPTNIEFRMGTVQLRPNPNATLPPAIGANGEAIISVRSSVPGYEQNAAASTSGTTNVAISGINSTVVMMGALCGGRNIETVAEFRVRVIARFKYSPKGDFAWIVEEFKKWPCVTRVERRVCNNCCPGLFEVYVYFDGSFAYGIPTQQLANDLTRWMFGNPNGAGLGRAAVGVFGKVYLPNPKPVDIQIINLDCITSDQKASLTSQISEMFARTAPGTKFAKRWLDAAIIALNPKAGNYSISITYDGLTISTDCGDSGDINPDCDDFPYLRSLRINE